MANQTITVNTNHDALTGRAAGENITINDGAVLTIDSMPQHTAMGLMGQWVVNNGTVLIDARKVRETVYASGSGTLPAVGAAVSWSGGSGKVIRLNSGTAVSGVVTITVQTGVDPVGTITDSGSWSATVSTDKVGYLEFFVEDGAMVCYAGSLLQCLGEWYELGTGDGTNNQTFTLPHNGTQACIWIEEDPAGAPGVLTKWHHVYNGNDSVSIYDQLSDWGADYRNGKVFAYDPAAGSTVTFGTTTDGGAPPNNSKLYIPNLHLGTALIASPTVENVGSTTVSGQYCVILDLDTSQKLELDRVNISTVLLTLQGIGDCDISSSCIGVNVSNCFRYPTGVLTATDSAWCGGDDQTWVGDPYVIIDATAGMTFTNCLFSGGSNPGTSEPLLSAVNSKNINFVGTTKLVVQSQDENSNFPVELLNSVDITFQQLIALNGRLNISSSSNIVIDNLVFGVLAARGTTEDNFNTLTVSGISNNVLIKAGELAPGGPTKIKIANSAFCSVVDASNVRIRNIGAIDNKVPAAGRGGIFFSAGGSCANVLVQRVWFDGWGGAMSSGSSTTRGVTLENCSSDYASELEMECGTMTARGLHCASGGPGSITGIENDYINISAACFYDVFTSDTTGLIGITFNLPGTLAPYITITAGLPYFNGQGDLKMSKLGDQVEMEVPYTILGHTGFANLPFLFYAVSATWSNVAVKYALDKGAGWGAWTDCTGANLSGESAPAGGWAAGFKIKFQFTMTADYSATLNGFAVQTTTTLADQAANLYPLDQVTLTITGLPDGTDVVILENDTTNTLLQLESSLGDVTYQYETLQTVDIKFYKAGYIPDGILNYVLGADDTTLPVTLTLDPSYST